MTRRVAFIYEEALSRHVLRQDHPMRPVRLRHTYELLQAYGAFDSRGSILVSPRPATEAELMWFHDEEYIAAVRDLSMNRGECDPYRFNFGSLGDNPIYAGMYEAAALSTGASLVAAEMVANRSVDVAFNISGGLHHAAPRHASGFCIFNDPVIAIKYLLSMGLRVAYVDIDAHHGDGVQKAFFDDDRVLTISIHESGKFLFPGTGSTSEIGVGPGVGFSVNLPLYPYTADEDYVWAFSEIVLPLVESFAPNVMVTQLGIDSYYNDPLSHLQLTSAGYVKTVQMCSSLGLPWLALGGGGYDISAVARCWTLAYGVMLGVEWPNQIPGAVLNVHGTRKLRDEVALGVQKHKAGDVRRALEEGVASIIKDVFPFHMANR
jgi:acetoin utilization protein AcuC